MKSTRQRILEQVEARGTVSAAELAIGLKTSRANIRHHLAVLVQQDTIEIVGNQLSGRRGRPSYRYTLSREARQNNLSALVSAIFEELIAHLPQVEKEAVLRQVARRLAGKEQTQNSTLSQRLVQAVKKLNEYHYQARWEAHASTPRFILGHCPYASILKDHPEICLLDAFLLQELLGTTTHQEARLARDIRGSTFCRFSIGEGAQKK